MSNNLSNNFNILFVDDDPDFRNEHVSALKNEGFAVVEAEGESQGRELAARQQFDLAVVDLMMEHTDSGFTLCYHLKKNTPSMPILLVSSANSEMGMEFSLDTPADRSWIKADAMLNKPLRSEQIVAEINRLLGVLAH